MQILLGLGMLGVVLFIFLLLIIGPYFTILALNTLFNLQIPFTFSTWLATFWLHWIFAGSASTRSKS